MLDFVISKLCAIFYINYNKKVTHTQNMKLFDAVNFWLIVLTKPCGYVKYFSRVKMLHNLCYFITVMLVETNIEMKKYCINLNLIFFMINTSDLNHATNLF